MTETDTTNKPIQTKPCHFRLFVLQTVKKEERTCQFVFIENRYSQFDTQSPRDSSSASRAECQCGCFMTRASITGVH